MRDNVTIYKMISGCSLGDIAVVLNAKCLNLLIDILNISSGIVLRCMPENQIVKWLR